MFKNTTNSRKMEALLDSEFWRMVIEQACINKALSIMMNAKGDMRHTLNRRNRFAAHAYCDWHRQ